MTLARVVSAFLPLWPTLAAAAQPSSPVTPTVAPVPTTMQVTILKSQHRRLIFPTDLARIAVGDAGIAEAQLISNRELLLLGVAPGRTTLIVWFLDGTFQQYAVDVQRDLSLLASALKRIDASIVVEVAPDRDAVVLTGTVPDLVASQTAEAMARDYLGAGTPRQGLAARPLVQASPAGATPAAGTDTSPASAPTAAPETAPVQLAAPVAPTPAVINLLRLATLPALPEDKVRDAIRTIGGAHVSVRRVLKGSVRDDANDTLVLEGTVPDQVALVRVLEMASRLFAGRTTTTDDIRVVADESGALSGRQQAGVQNTTASSLGSSLPGVGASMGSASTGRLTNQIERNIGRAKAIEVAGGRVLSFIDVVDLPQVRIDIRLFEVSRSKLRSYTPQSIVSLSTRVLPAAASIVPGAVPLQGRAVENVLGFLSGQTTNETQLVGRHAAVDTTLSLLEREGVARRLSSPSLTVLSGEQAQFQVGGEIPIPVAFAPAFGTGDSADSATALGVFSSVTFRPFGIQLGIRPLVDDADAITLDVQPQIVDPSADLTASIRDATGAAPPTIAFETRALRTSARLLDGQSLVIGGLLSNTSSANTQVTPGLGSLPGLGWLFKGFDRNDQSTELVIVVSPSIIRQPIPAVARWAFPDAREVSRSIGRAAAPPAGGQ